MIPVASVEGHAFKAVAVMGTGFLAGAVIPRLPDLAQKLLLHRPGFLMAALFLQLVLPDGQFVAVDFNRLPPVRM